LEGHRQQHEPHDQRFQQYFHDDNSSILKKLGCRRSARRTVRATGRLAEPRLQLVKKSQSDRTKIVTATFPQKSQHCKSLRRVTAKTK
jgi:hypothetical protein